MRSAGRRSPCRIGYLWDERQFEYLERAKAATCICPLTCVIFLLLFSTSPHDRDLIVHASCPSRSSGIWADCGSWGSNMSVAVPGFIRLRPSAETGIHLTISFKSPRGKDRANGRPLHKELYAAIMSRRLTRTPQMITVVAIMAGLMPFWPHVTGSNQQRIARPILVHVHDLSRYR